MKITSCYCINLRNAANTVTKLYDRYLEPFEITIRQYSLMVNLKQCSETSVTRLADWVGLERTSVTRLVKPLISRGLVADISASGSRDALLVLTNDGEKLINTALPAWEAAQAEMETIINPDDLKRMMDGLSKIV